jgi:DNA invertase Pin-like site-specific DNA recombinase
MSASGGTKPTCGGSKRIAVCGGSADKSYPLSDPAADLHSTANGVRLVSITQELGDDPMSNMIRQIMALFDEYQSKENAKHTLRAMKENARQGFWNGSLPPIGHTIAAPPRRVINCRRFIRSPRRRGRAQCQALRARAPWQS